MKFPGRSDGSKPHVPHDLSLLSKSPPTRAWREEAFARAAEIQGLSDWIDKLHEKRLDELGEPDADAARCLADAIKSHVAAVYKAASGRRPCGVPEVGLGH